MAKVKTKHSWEFGGTRTTGSGEIKFDKEGLSQEIDDNVAQALANASPSLVVDGEIEKQIEDIKPKAIVVETKDDPADDLTGADLAADVDPEDVVVPGVDAPQDDVVEHKSAFTKEDLVELNIGEIRAILVQAEIPESEWEHFKGKDAKDPLIDFVLTKV